ncbi:hypothetical protein MNBD_GAMMA20-2075 [hydrothermal vent metagenome]|uniref:Uncharacterized protein n=1 Tax=hydrothermal vent metagenome TaxID=652676 RepID=A0A3B1B5S6_9ZZZZ
MSLFLMKHGGGQLLEQYHFLPVHAVANEQYIPTVWDGREKGTASEQHSDAGKGEEKGTLPNAVKLTK